MEVLISDKNNGSAYNNDDGDDHMKSIKQVGMDLEE